jgi:hypothetical protein
MKNKAGAVSSANFSPQTGQGAALRNGPVAPTVQNGGVRPVSGLADHLPAR